MRANELRRLSDEELTQRVSDSADDLFRMRFQLISGQLQNHRQIREVKREIARIKTIIRERESQDNQESTEIEDAPTGE
jgi:large subunit ribosomal protein L29